jgi:hypothetical protein
MSAQHRTGGVRSPLTLLLPLALVGLSGCAGGDLPASVAGKVTYRGKPVTSGVVVLVGEDGKVSQPASVQPDGTFTIAHAPAGKVKVSLDNPRPVVPHVPAAARSASVDEEAREAAAQARLYVPTPPKFKDPDQSGVTLDLHRGSNTCDIALP